MRTRPIFPPPAPHPWPELSADIADMNWMWLEEAAHFAEPYRAAGGKAAVARLTEAELVRRMKAGQNLDDPATGVPTAAAPPQVRDPALARALDLLKGLAVVRAVKP